MYYIYILDLMDYLLVSCDLAFRDIDREHQHFTLLPTTKKPIFQQNPSVIQLGW